MRSCVSFRMYLSSIADSPARCSICNQPRCTMTRFAGLLAAFLILPLLMASHMPEDADPESEDTKEESFCPSATVQIHTGSGHVVRSDQTGVVGTCTHWSVIFNAPLSSEVLTYFYVYEVRSNGVWSLISSTVCGPAHGECGAGWGSVAPSSNIVVIGSRPSGGIGGAVAELDTSNW